MFTINYTRAFAMPLAILSLVIGLSHPAAADTWQRYRSAAGGYVIQSPGPLAEISNLMRTSVGIVTNYIATYQTADERAIYGVTYADYPVSDRRPLDEIFNAIRDGLSKDGRVLSERSAVIDGRPGRLFIGKTDGDLAFVNLVVVDGHRRYQVSYVTRDSKVSDSTPFFDSFRITR